MPEDTTYIKQLIKKSNRIETHAGTTGLNDFKYLDGDKVSPNVPYHVMYMHDGAEIYVTELDFNESKSEIIMRQRNETDYKEYVRSRSDNQPPFFKPTPYKFVSKPTDAKKGFINRVFIRIAANEESIPVEIKATGFAKVPKTYKKVKVKWKITGDIDEIKKHNINAIEKAEKTVSNLIMLPITALDGYVPKEKDKELMDLQKKLDRMDIY